MSAVLKEFNKRLGLIQAELDKSLDPVNSSASYLLAESADTVSKNALSIMHEPLLDLLSRGGKRWRPLLSLLSYELQSSNTASGLIIELSPIVELVHNATLIADDIEDKSEFRRGDFCIHLKYGIDVALNSSNWLYFAVTRLISKSKLSPERKLLLYESYSQTLQDIHLGQALDISWHNDHSYLPSLEEYEAMVSLKTGALLAFAAWLGIFIANASIKHCQAVALLWKKIGCIFQIADDLSNLEKGNLGKTRGDDLLEAKKSYPILLYLKQFPQQREYVLGELAQAQRTKIIPYYLIEELSQSSIFFKIREYIDQQLIVCKKDFKKLFKRENPAYELLLNLINAVGKN